MTTAISLTTRAIESLDYIPIVSTGKSLVDLFVKYAVFPFLSSETIINNGYLSLVDDTSLCRHIIVAIPVLGNVTIALFDYAQTSLSLTEERILGILPHLENRAFDCQSLLLRLAPRDLLRDKRFAQNILPGREHLFPHFSRQVREDLGIQRMMAIHAIPHFKREIWKFNQSNPSPAEKESFKQKFGEKIWASVSPDLREDLEIQCLYYGIAPWTLGAKGEDRAFVNKLLDDNPVGGPIAYPYFSEELQKDLEIAKRCVSTIRPENLHSDILSDRAAAIVIVATYINYIGAFSQFNQDRAFWLDVLNLEEYQKLSSLEFIKHLPPHLHADREILERIREAHTAWLKEQTQLSRIIAVLGAFPDFFKTDQALLTAYKEALMRLTRISRFSKEVRATIIFCVYKSAVNTYSISDREFFEEYINKIIKPLFNDDELNQTLSQYAESLKGDLE